MLENVPGLANNRRLPQFTKDLERLGYRVETAPSPWRLAPADAGLANALAEGAAGAVRETGLVPEPEIAAWLAARRSGALCTVGHLDLLALPGG